MDILKLKLLYDITTHPLNRHRKLNALKRFLAWQIGSRLVPGPVVSNFVDQSRLLVHRGQPAATGNLYQGLVEFHDMAFLLHFLRKNDLFVDVGANIGTFTVLASAVREAYSIAIEPIHSTFNYLMDNLNLNGITARVEALNLGVGRSSTMLNFYKHKDTKNCVALETRDLDQTIEVNVMPLDEIVKERSSSLLKIDVEGFETEVIAGADKVLSCQSLKAVIIELRGHGCKYGFDEAEVHNKLLDYGFKSHLYDPFSRELTSVDGINQSNGNTLYIRDSDLVQVRLKAAPLVSIQDKIM